MGGGKNGTFLYHAAGCAGRMYSEFARKTRIFDRSFLRRRENALSSYMFRARDGEEIQS